MKIVFSNAAEFKKMVDALSVLVDEAEFSLTDAGVSLKATDPSQISMVDFILPKVAFSSYAIEGDLKLGLDLSYLSQVMGRAKPSESMEWALDEATGKLNVSFMGSSTRSFQVPLLDISSQELPTPKVTFTAKATIKAPLISDALKDATLVSNHVGISLDEKKMVIDAQSSKGSIHHEFPKSDAGVVSIDAQEESKSLFPLDFLQDMLKVPNAETDVVIELKTNHPIRLSYAIGPAKIAYFLAPRIDA